MTARKDKKAAAEGKRGWIDIATSRITRITALVTAIGLLVGAIVKNLDPLQDWWKKSPSASAPRPCIEITGLETPKTVSFSDWEDMPVTVLGRNNCEQPLGLYVTFLRRTGSDASFLLRAPRDDLAECRGASSVLVPHCWDPKKPVAKGDLQWKTLPPPLKPLRDPSAKETIWFLWDVRNYDEPDKPLATDSKKIEVTHDASIR